MAGARAYAAALAGAAGGRCSPDLPCRGGRLVVYLALNLVYSRWLKHVPLLDICVVAAGFGLRVLQGYAATGGAGLRLAAGRRVHRLPGAHRRQAPPRARRRPVRRTGRRCAATTSRSPTSCWGSTPSWPSSTFLLYLRFDAPFGAHRDTVLMWPRRWPCSAFSATSKRCWSAARGGDPVRTLLRDRLIVADAGLLARPSLHRPVATHLASYS